MTRDLSDRRRDRKAEPLMGLMIVGRKKNKSINCPARVIISIEAVNRSVGFNAVTARYKGFSGPTDHRQERDWQLI